MADVHTSQLGYGFSFTPTISNNVHSKRADGYELFGDLILTMFKTAETGPKSILSKMAPWSQISATGELW